jgi:nucleoid-associated protein YgaU
MDMLNPPALRERRSAMTDDTMNESREEIDQLKREWRAEHRTRQEEAEAPEAEAPAAPEPRVYVVQKGDSLSQIAKDVYGDASRWREIYESNKDKIKDPKIIRPGQELRIP